MNTKEHREATPLETILINAEDAGLNIGQTAKLIEEHFIAKSKEEAEERYEDAKIYLVDEDIASRAKLGIRTKGIIREALRLAAFGKEDEG